MGEKGPGKSDLAEGGLGGRGVQQTAKTRKT